MARGTWSVQDAKNRFSEVVEAARRRPQTVTKHGKPAVVVVAADEYDRLRKLQQLKAPSFAELLLAMPQGDVEFERLNAEPRDVEF
jgi:antitoxin Phd